MASRWSVAEGVQRQALVLAATTRDLRQRSEDVQVQLSLLPLRSPNVKGQWEVNLPDPGVRGLIAYCDFDEQVHGHHEGAYRPDCVITIPACRDRGFRHRSRAISMRCRPMIKPSGRQHSLST